MFRFLKHNRLLLVFLLIYTQTLSSQTTSVKYENYNTKDGLSHSLITSIVKDDKGFLWIATQNGLNRFDGYDFKNYYASKSNKTPLKNNIRNLYKDSFNNIWISYYMGGVECFNPETGIFTTYNPDNNDENSISSNVFPTSISGSKYVKFFEDSNNVLWITSNKGLNKFNRKTNNFTTYKYNKNNVNSLSDNSVTSIAEDKFGNLWIGTYNGLNRLNKETGSIERIITTELNNNIQPQISKIKSLKNGTILIGTINSGLFVIKNSNSKTPVEFTAYFNKYANSKVELAILEIVETSKKILLGTTEGLYQLYNNKHEIIIDRVKEIEKSEINNIVEDSKGQIWVSKDYTSSNKHFLYLFNSTLSEYNRFVQNKTSNISLSSVPVNILYAVNNVVYLGSKKLGLYKINTKTSKFKSINTSTTNSLHITDNDVYSIYQDYKDNLWVGTSQTLNKIDLAKKTTKTLNNYKIIKHNISYEYSKKLSAKLIGNIVETKNHDLWLGSFDYKISKYDVAKNKFLNYHHNPSDKTSFSGWSTRAICVTKSDEVYVGGYNMGLYKLNEDGKSFKHYTDFDKDEINEQTVYSIIEDEHKTIWIGTYKGLVSFNPKNEKFTSHIDTNYTTQNSIRAILEPTIYNNTNSLWLATDTGLILFNKKNNTFKVYNKSNGLLSNTVLGLLEDRSGNIWASTLKGLVKFNPGNNTIKSYTEQDGIQGNEFNEGAYFKNKDGIMYFGGTNGITYFNPDEIKNTVSNGGVFITDIKINNKYVGINDTVNGNVILSKDISYTKKITLSNNDKIININFASSDFQESNNTKFRYKLHGYNKHWVEIKSNHHSISFSNLNPGNYALIIDNSITDNRWSNNPTVLKIEIKPPFWQTLWFKITILSIILLLVFVYFIFYARNLEKQKKLLLITVEERTAKLKVINDELKENNEKIIELSEKAHDLDQKKIHFFTNISHEFRTPLSLILSPTEKLLSLNDYNDTELVQKNLKIIDRNSKRLFNLITQLLELPKAEQVTLKLLVAKGNIVEFIEEIFNLFEGYANAKNVELKFSNIIKNGNVYFDSDKIEKILYNLLSNAINYTPEGGTVELELYEVKSYNSLSMMCIKVKDTGRGIPKEKVKFIFDRFYQIERKTTSKNISSGIGLSLVDSLVKAYRGKINVDTEVDKGTSFDVFLPFEKECFEEEEFRLEGEKEITYKYSKSMLSVIDEKDDKLELPNKTGKTEEHKELIIIVEDNEDLNDFLLNELSNDYKVLSAFNGKEGLELAKTNSPSLILSDIAMPIMDGIELCKKLKTDINTSHVSVFLLTAKTDEAQQLEGLSIGADDYINKPFNLASLKLRISNVIETRKNLVSKFASDTKPIPEGIKINELDHDLLKKIVEYVEKNIDTDITGDILANELGLSKSNLYKKLKNLTGFSVNIYIRNIRLDVASKLLKNGKYSISEIAYAVGFNNPKYFSSCFMKHYGESPRNHMK
ncbi:MAG: response regulator [Ichthyobacteriaceae bacterium]|nr:response regulator [Ichthyobacteriaceae bacterium]